MSRCPLGFGNFSFSYLYIIGVFVTKLLEDYLISLDDIKSDLKYNIFGFTPQLKKHKLIKSLYKDLGFIIFGLLFFYLQKDKKKKSHEISTLTQRTTLRYEKYLDESKSILKELLIISSLYALQSIIRKIISFFKLSQFDFWIFNILFIILFMNHYFIINIYKHQKYSLISIFIINFILVFSSNIIRVGINVNGKEKLINSFEYVEEMFGNSFYSLFVIIIYILLSIIKSFTRVLSKKLMNDYYQLIYKIIIFIGIFGFIFTLITLIFTSIFICNENIKSLCKVNGHFDDIFVYYSDIKEQLAKEKLIFFIEILLVIPLFSFSSFIHFTFELLIIFHLDPNYILISDCIYYAIVKLLKYCFENSKNINNFYINILSEILSIIGYFIYLEIIELRFCGLNKDIKINIIERGNYLFSDDESILEIDNYYVNNLNNDISICEMIGK